MSKIDEMLEELESKSVDFDYITKQDTTIASWVTIPQVMYALRQLRPFVELGEIFRYSKYHDEEYLLNDGIDDIVEQLIQQIKEQE